MKPDGLVKADELELRISNLKSAIKVLSAIILVILYSNSCTSRSYLAQDVQTLGHGFARLHMSLDMPDSAGLPTWLMVSEVNKTLRPLDRNFNWIERRRAGRWDHTYIDSTLSDLMELLQLRRQQGFFTERDEEIAEYIDGQVEFLRHQTESDGERLMDSGFGIFRNPFTFLDTKTLAQRIKDLNLAVAAYYYYAAFPDELEALSDQELVHSIEQSLPWEDMVVTMADNGITWQDFTVEWENGRHSIAGQIDRFTGRITSLAFGKSDSTDDEFLYPERLAEPLTDLLTALYGSEYTFDIEYTGWVGGLHHFHWTPIYKGVKFEERSFQGALFNPETSMLDQIHGIMVPDNPIDVTENYTPEQGKEIMGLGDSYHYHQTLIVNSALTNTWVVVHRYQGEHPADIRYLNAVTGLEDFKGYDFSMRHEKVWSLFQRYK